MKSNKSRMAIILGLRPGTTLNSQALADRLRQAGLSTCGTFQTRIGVVEAHAFSKYADRLKPRQNVAAVEFTASGENAISVLTSLISKSTAAMGDIADPSQSNIVVGPLHVVDHREGDLMVMIACRRKPHFTADGYHEWWLTHHVPVGQALCGGTLPFSAEMIHVDRSLSEQACRDAKYSWEPIDSFEMLVADSQSLDAFFSDQAIQQGLSEDEAGGGTDISSLSIALLTNHSVD